MLRFLTIFAYLCAAPFVSAEDWLQWRGPERNGVSPGPAWPESLEESRLTRSHRVEMGKSYSGPIVAGDRVFTTETKGDSEIVRAFERRTGKQLWETQWKGTMTVPFFAWSNGSWIRATPACDGETLYVAGMRDTLVALNTADGSERWRIDFLKKYGTPLPAFGFVSSPLIDGEDLYVQAAAGVVKIAKRTGEVQWRNFVDDGGMYGSAFSSPKIETIGGIRQLVVQSREKLAGLDLAAGSPLWEQKVEAFRGMNILTPTFFGDLAFTSTYGGKTIGFRIDSSSGRFAAKQEWSDSAQGYMSSPVAVGKHVYLHLRNQRFACFDVEQGKRLWTSEPFGKYASLALRGDRILALDERGELLLIAADPEQFRLISRRRVSDEETWAHIALADDQIFIRELNALSIWKWDATASP